MDKSKLMPEELILLKVVQDENKVGTISDESLAKMLNTSIAEGKISLSFILLLNVPEYMTLNGYRAIIFVDCHYFIW